MKALRVLAIMAVIAVLAVSSATAQRLSDKKFEVISAVSLKKLMDDKVAMTLVDARFADEYAEGHIPGAINMPPDKLSLVRSILPKDRGALVITYCRGFG